MKKFRNKRFSRMTAAVGLITSVAACSKSPSPSIPPNVPQSWYQLPEDQQNDVQPGAKMDEATTLEKLSRNVGTIFNANSEALEKASLSPASPVNPENPIPPGIPKDWVPWHAEVFTTDLTLTVGGLLGSLMTKGSPTVRAYWRQQGPAPQEQTLASLEKDGEAAAVLIQEDTKPEEVMAQMEPAIRAAASTGKIQDSPELRQELLSAARDFQTVAAVIPSSDPDLPWWVSRFRLDVSIDASGRVTQIGTVGGEVRFRFEWHRIKRSRAVGASRHTLSARQLSMRNSLLDFVTGTAYDLESAFTDVSALGFQAHTIRMGIGVSVKGNIGVVKGSAGIVGQIYFTRNAKKPTIRPRALEFAKSNSPVLLIERKPAPDHLEFAKRNHLTYELHSLEERGPIEEAVYQMDREAFRKGLKKAAKITQFFAEKAAHAQSGSWKVYELRATFDASISGDLDLVSLTGTATAQISFFNQNF